MSGRQSPGNFQVSKNRCLHYVKGVDPEVVLRAKCCMFDLGDASEGAFGPRLACWDQFAHCFFLVLTEEAGKIMPI